MKKFVYFETASNDAIMLPLDNYLGTHFEGKVTTLLLSFAKVDNALDVSTVQMITKPFKGLEAMEDLHAAFASDPKDGFIMIGNDNDANFTNLENITNVGTISL
tara:strand:+ start:774 stop:1085 length:312 start_codon:yes stop_codon:yes gene_type:complete